MTLMRNRPGDVNHLSGDDIDRRPARQGEFRAGARRDLLDDIGEAVFDVEALKA